MKKTAESVSARESNSTKPISKPASHLVAKSEILNKCKKSTKNEIAKIKQIMLERYKDAKSELKYNNIYELLVSVILSAQCTDKRVNLTTPSLFARFPSIADLASADVEEVKELIKSISFFNVKAQNLVNMAKQVVEHFGGEIPRHQESLKMLSGVGQKSANVVLLEYCNLNVMAVDTHVFRTSHRLGLSQAKSAEETESELSMVFKDNLHILHQAFVLFGRYICKAKNPLCTECFLVDFCKSKESFKPT